MLLVSIQFQKQSLASRSEIHYLPLHGLAHDALVSGAVLRVELRVPLAVLLDQGIPLAQDWIHFVHLVVPHHDIALNLSQISVHGLILCYIDVINRLNLGTKGKKEPVANLNGLAEHVELGNEGGHGETSPYAVVEILQQRLHWRQRLHKRALAEERLPCEVHETRSNLRHGHR